MYVALFAVSVLGLLGYVYWDTLNYLDEQTDQSIQAELDTLLGQYRQTGPGNLHQSLAQRSLAGHDADQIYLLVDRTYVRLAGNLPQWPPELRHRSGWIDLATTQREGGEHEEIKVRMFAAALPGGYHLLLGRNLHEREDLHEHILQVLAVAISVSLALAMLGGLLMSRGILRRVEHINRTGRSIIAGHLEQRIPVSGSGDEFDQLAINLNAMLVQIQQLMEGLRQVTDNVAHDLRNPLNRLRSRLELMLLNPRSTEEYRAAGEETLSDINDVLNTFNALLDIAQAEAGTDQGSWTQFDLSKLLRDAAEFYEPLAEANGLHFSWHIAEHLTLRGNSHLLTQAVGNLLDNAIKYTQRGGIVQLGAHSSGDAIEVTVCDNGPGIPKEMRNKVLERFVRLQASRTTPGNGLGLSLVRAVAQLHHAKLELSDNSPGLKIVLRFYQEKQKCPAAIL